MERKNQGGSVMSFIVIGAVLTALLVGGVYFLNQRSNPSTPPTQQPHSDQSNQPKPQAGEKESPAPSPDTSNHHAASQLPATGSKETLGTLLAIGLISGVSTSYIRSRRPHLSL